MTHADRLNEEAAFMQQVRHDKFVARVKAIKAIALVARKKVLAHAPHVNTHLLDRPEKIDVRTERTVEGVLNNLAFDLNHATSHQLSPLTKK